jgi:hypothetical protein
MFDLSFFGFHPDNIEEYADNALGKIQRSFKGITKTLIEDVIPRQEIK